MVSKNTRLGNIYNDIYDLLSCWSYEKLDSEEAELFKKIKEEMEDFYIDRNLDFVLVNQKYKLKKVYSNE